MKRRIIKLLAINRIGYAIKLFKENIFNMSKIDIYNIFHYKGFKEYYFNKFLLDYCENIFPNTVSVTILEDIISPNSSYDYMIQNFYDIEYIKLSFDNDICVKAYGIFPITRFLSYLEKTDKINKHYIMTIVNFMKCNHYNRAYCFEHNEESVMIKNTNEHITEYFINEKIISLMSYISRYQGHKLCFMSIIKIKFSKQPFKKMVSQCDILRTYIKHYCENIKKLDFYYGKRMFNLLDFIKNENRENKKIILRIIEEINLENE